MTDEKGSPERRAALLETCFDVFCQNGLENTGLKLLADACGLTNGALLYYFGSKDNLVIEATAHCMAKVEDDFMAQAPQSFEDIERFLREMPYLTAELHGAKYRFMYQVYASPKYREHGKAFFKGVSVRYQKYAERLSGKLGLPVDYIRGMIYIFVRACVHYALFEDEEYLNLQLDAVRASLRAFMAIQQQELKDDDDRRQRDGKDSTLSVRFDIEGTVIDLPLKYDEGPQMYLEDYHSVIENPPYTPEGRPILFTFDDACAHADMVDGEQTSVECSTCRYFRYIPGSLLGVCHNEKMRATNGVKEETL